MSSIIIASIIIRWIAVFWSVLLLVRLKDWRMGFFSVMFALMAVCQGMTLRAGVETISMELSGVAVSIMGLLAVIFLKRIITKQLKDEGELRSAYNQTEYLLSSSPAVIYKRNI